MSEVLNRQPLRDWPQARGVFAPGLFSIDARREPFKHWVIDGMFDPGALRGVLSEWPAEMTYFKKAVTSIKGHVWQWEKFGSMTRWFIEQLSGAAFLSWLEETTGERDLIADPALSGGGLHEVPPGGFLKMHVDFNWNKSLRAARVLNLLLYLNEGWEEQMLDGHLVLSPDGDSWAQKAIAYSPNFNRCVIFPTTDRSWHGHPEPLRASRSRRSIALYYYRRGPKPKAHGTIYKEF